MVFSDTVDVDMVNVSEPPRRRKPAIDDEARVAHDTDLDSLFEEWIAPANFSSASEFSKQTMLDD